MGSHLCSRWMPTAAQIRHADSLNPGLTGCPGNTSLLTTSSVTTTLWRCSIMLPTEMGKKNKQNKNAASAGFHTEKFDAKLTKILVVDSCDIMNHPASNWRHKTTTKSNSCQNHVGSKSYFHYSRSIPQRSWWEMNSDIWLCWCSLMIL